MTEHDRRYLIEIMTIDMVRMVMATFSLGLDRALDWVYNSSTYQRMCNSGSPMIYASPAYVFSFLEEEIRTGKLVSA